MIDEYTGIPAYTHGVAAPSGAGATSTGLAMLMTAAGKIIKNVTESIDTRIVEPSVTWVYEHLMRYHPDPSIKGDAQVVAVGSGSLIAKEQRLIRMRELLDATRNDVDMQIIGLDGRAEFLRKVFRAYELDIEDIIPDEEELMPQEQQFQAMLAAKAMPSTANLAVPGPQTLDLAGNPAGGTDSAVFTPQPQGA
jgi:hypothetical protein